MSDPFADPYAEVEGFPEHGNDATDNDGNLVGEPVERTAKPDDFPPADYEYVPDERYTSDHGAHLPQGLSEDDFVSDNEVPDPPPGLSEGDEGDESGS
jgi:hypothetical protein